MNASLVLPLLMTLVSLAVTGAAAAGPAPAVVPDTGVMIEALQPEAGGGTRNLVVRPTAQGAVGAPAEAATVAEPRPGLSLAIQFEPSSPRVRPESGAVLGNLVAAMLSPELRANRFVIEGHTDARGARAINQRLSQQRAEDVRLLLGGAGREPIASEGRGQGRRRTVNPRGIRSPARTGAYAW